LPKANKYLSFIIYHLPFIIKILFADVILPLALQSQTFSYSVPTHLEGELLVGMRVEVPFGRSKLYSGVVARLHNEKPAFEVKEIVQRLDDVAITTELQLRFWRWMSAYYLCTLGEVMAAALPGNLKLSSETRILYCEDYGEDFNGFSDDEFLVAEALLIQKEINLDDARKILNKQTVFPVVQSLMQRGVAMVREELVQKFKPKQVTAVRLCEPYRSDSKQLAKAFELIGTAQKQQNALLAFLAVAKGKPYVLKQEIVDKTEVTEAVFNALRKKEILETYSREISRLGGYEEEFVDAAPMSVLQQEAWSQVQTIHAENKPCMLFGVTGSGKTRIYAEAIKEQLNAGKQVLYLVPEITLTTQLINRLQKLFSDDIMVYHSRVNYNERAEIYKAISQGGKVILSARSGMFLPFQNLGLIIIDEEHDGSYKQSEPAPRYQARDCAIVLAGFSGANVILGTGTPSLETWQNVVENKYGLVRLTERFGGIAMPEVSIIDLKEAVKGGKLKSAFSLDLIESCEKTIENGEQVILFQNRRGFAPIQDCQNCEYTARCPNCDIALTYHKGANRLRCHYCSYHCAPHALCPQCKSPKMALHGHGTERLEDELDMYLPKAKIARMDYDTAGSKTNLEALLHDFEEKRIDVLIGTQMVTKGLDFEHVGLVGVVAADQLLKAPHFRANERAWQLLVQVSGRAGRKHKQGKVLIQTWKPKHPVIQESLTADFDTFVARELLERKRWRYPPYYRLIHIAIRHKVEDTCIKTADYFAKELKKVIGERVHGPSVPGMKWVRGYHVREILLKIEKNASVILQTKALLMDIDLCRSGMKDIRQSDVVFDVDP
jgi:primosomal protein N' (replication factor Y) (superfamily II helicase)